MQWPSNCPSFRPRMLAVYIVAFALTLVSAKPLRDSLVVHERRNTAPFGFMVKGAAPSEEVLNLRINLVQNDLAGLESAVLAAATPSSPTYGQWLSKEQVEAFSRPTDETTAAVNQWLSDNGIDSTPLSASGDWISIRVPVSKANELLNADFNVFTHAASGVDSIRTLEYSLPASLQNHIKVVTPTTSFAAPRRSGPVFQAAKIQERATVPSSCKNTMTPTCLQALYSIPTTAATNKTGSIGVAGFDDQFANQADLTQFLKAQRTDMSSSTAFTLTSVDGGTNSQTRSQAGVEADLDIQYTVGLATGVPVTFVSVGTQTKDGADEGFLDIITALIAESAPPQVLTTSYGFNTEASLSKSLTFAMCDSYMQLASRGVSILFASGDGGVAATPGESCNNKPFLPTFPTCPFVTLVGATTGSPETGASLSAGGFSNYFATQSWQASAVSTYISSIGTQYAGKYNTTGRGYPDVSAIGESVWIVQDASTGLVDGTSCSSPIFASVIGLINDRLLAAGKPVLGFLNPWLYANPGMFNDITSGTNPGCGTQGFSAKAGWDPVTGLGSPNFPAMLKAAGL
ncbi:Subtilisin-like protein [Mycena indigotica]|uniref:Subtilisin-like protein n=1 Tax=Mycena indigotica TaxID=2126181 RepID=A0A8H6S7Z7_9AGAR|nr:Subtilisin-like protein [Mycena indigotica]KAF7294544.1 Subtilisin-like protein [Mycena indigotica]